MKESIATFRWEACAPRSLAVGMGLRSEAKSVDLSATKQIYAEQERNMSIDAIDPCWDVSIKKLEKLLLAQVVRGKWPRVTSLGRLRIMSSYIPLNQERPRTERLLTTSSVPESRLKQINDAVNANK